MKRLLIISASLLAVAGAAGGGYWMLREPPARWTTSSPAALAAFEQGFDEMSKLYWTDARANFQRAVELDPDFAVAKRYLAPLSEEEERERLSAELEAVDLERLRPHERFLIADWLARDKPDAERQAILDDFLRRHPESFFGQQRRCHNLWKNESWDQAQACYERLLELRPNWVEAHNLLGYIAMARGRFSEAEERFRTYRYVAPDQANPYDSMAELLMLLGRYEEASASADEAIRIKPDFCHAYELRALIGLWSGNLESSEEAVESLESIEACARMVDEGFSCSFRAVSTYFRGDAEAAWRQFDGDCLERRHGFDAFAHRAAVATGRLDEAAAMEEAVAERRRQADEEGRPVAADEYGAILAHMQGVRSLAAGDVPEAIEHLETADRLMGYWGGDRASFKLWNRLNLLHALELGGETARAEALRRKLEAVNPRILADVELADLVGLAAG
jgi:tetratricopeptide (TPR) repeat protein